MVSTMRIAVLSDIHGNTWAFETVLKDIKKRNIKTILNLGDSLYGPLDPEGTAKIIQKYKIISISGNEDRIILENINRETKNHTLNYVINELSNDSIKWLVSLKDTMIFENILFLCHGTPNYDYYYLSEKIRNKKIYRKNKADLKNEVKNISQDIILCGHSHFPRKIEVNNKKIINPGSVGLQAYTDDFPSYHTVENGDPDARYLILTIEDNTLKTEFINLSYNFEKAVEYAENNNRNDWAKWLKTGVT